MTPGNGLTDRELGWLEGLIDGEGTLFLVPRRRHDNGDRIQWIPGVQIANNNRELLGRVQRLLGGGSIWSSKKGKYARTFYYRFSRPTMREILPGLRLIVKREQRQVLLEALELLTGPGVRKPSAVQDRLQELSGAMRDLNGRHGQ